MAENSTLEGAQAPAKQTSSLREDIIGQSTRERPLLQNKTKDERPQGRMPLFRR
jgi:hypothetical protein